MRRNDAIDVLRVFAMAAVVFIHCRFPGAVGKAVVAVGRFAVPVFFMISGYYLYGADRRTVLRRAKKTAAMTLASVVIYTSFSAVRNGIGSVLSEFRLEVLIKLMAVNDPMKFMGAHTWYLFALIYCYLIIAVILKWSRFEKIMRLLPALLIVTICLSTVLPSLGIIKSNGLLYRNAFLTGLPFISLGYQIRKRDRSIKNTALLVCGAVFGMLLSICEGLFLLEANMHLGTIIAAFCLFCLAASSNAEYTRLAGIGRRYSGTVYIIHRLVINAIGAALKFVGLMDNQLIAWSMPIMVLFVSLICAMVYDDMRRRILNKRNCPAKK